MIRIDLEIISMHESCEEEIIITINYLLLLYVTTM